MLFDIQAINDYYNIKNCPNCRGEKVEFTFQKTEEKESGFVHCLECGVASKSITRQRYRTRLQDIDKIIEFWNHGQIIN